MVLKGCDVTCFLRAALGAHQGDQPASILDRPPGKVIDYRQQQAELLERLALIWRKAGWVGYVQRSQHPSDCPSNGGLGIPCKSPADMFCNSQPQSCYIRNVGRGG